MLLGRKECFMKYKEFKDWCNQRTADGCWSFKEALACVDACYLFSNIPFWKREYVWRVYAYRPMLEEIVTETNKIIEKTKQDTAF